MNDQACKLLKFNRSELVGQKLSSILRTRQCPEDALTGEVLSTVGNVITMAGKVVRCGFFCDFKRLDFMLFFFFFQTDASSC